MLELLPADNDVIKARATFTSKVEIDDPTTEISVRIIVTEAFVTGQAIGQFLPTDTLINVMRKILPNASGFIEKGSIADGQQVGPYEIDWQLDQMLNPDNLNIIALIQNEVTREVYQVLSVNLTGKSNKPFAVSDVTAKHDFSIYPNPADKEVNVVHQQGQFVIKGFQLYDQMGRNVKSAIFATQQDQIIIQTDNLANGVYLIFLDLTGNRKVAKQIIVNHN